MMNNLIRGTALTLSALAFACFSSTAQAQNQSGLETAAAEAGDGTATFGDMLDDLFERTPDAVDAGLERAGEASATGAAVSADRLERLGNGETAQGRPQVPTPMPANVGRPPVQAGPPAGVGGGRGGRF